MIFVEKLFDITQYAFMIKTFRKIRIEGNYLKLIKNICKTLELTCTMAKD